VKFLPYIAEDKAAVKKKKDGQRNLPILTGQDVLPTAWKFDEHIRDDMLSVAGFIFCPPEGDGCSGVPVSKQGISLSEGHSAGKKLDDETAESLQAEYSKRVSCIILLFSCIRLLLHCSCIPYCEYPNSRKFLKLDNGKKKRL
jgi:hypothetical protein